ncbi:hypothetical protein ACIRST_38475 [Kitasatospora sp. NPDC101447]
MDQQIFFCFFAGSAATAFLVLVAEAATGFLTPADPAETEDSDG